MTNTVGTYPIYYYLDGYMVSHPLQVEEAVEHLNSDTVDEGL